MLGQRLIRPTTLLLLLIVILGFQLGAQGARPSGTGERSWANHQSSAATPGRLSGGYIFLRMQRVVRAKNSYHVWTRTVDLVPKQFRDTLRKRVDVSFEPRLSRAYVTDFSVRLNTRPPIASRGSEEDVTVGYHAYSVSHQRVYACSGDDDTHLPTYLWSLYIRSTNTSEALGFADLGTIRIGGSRAWHLRKRWIGRHRGARMSVRVDLFISVRSYLLLREIWHSVTTNATVTRRDTSIAIYSRYGEHVVARVKLNKALRMRCVGLRLRGR